MDGNHDIKTSHDVTVEVLSKVYRELQNQNVDIECTLLKPNMVRQGVTCTDEIDLKKVGSYTVQAFQKTIPVSMPGVVFLSGGMSETDASIALNEINNYKGSKPWRLTFSYGRALQSSVLAAWKGKDENKKVAQETLLKLSENNGLASIGNFNKTDRNSKSLHESNYVY